MDDHYGWNCSLKPQILGFVISLVLIYAAYRLDQVHLTNPSTILFTIMTLCVLQGLAQFFFFLHLGMEQTPRWNLYAFLFTTCILFIVVTGTIWILQSLDHNLMRS